MSQQFLLIFASNFSIYLTDKGTLLEVCPHTHLIFPLILDLNYLIEDLMVLENNESDTELLMLTRMKDTNIHSIKIVSFPSMKCMYELPNVGKAWLVQQSKSNINMYYISGSEDEPNAVQQIEMKIISELQPEERYKKLLRKGFLEQAEDFAKHFNLNLQPLLEEKARRLVIEIGKLQVSYHICFKMSILISIINEFDLNNILTYAETLNNINLFNQGCGMLINLICQIFS